MKRGIRIVSVTLVGLLVLGIVFSVFMHLF
jgi:hypothetical protein